MLQQISAQPAIAHPRGIVGFGKNETDATIAAFHTSLHPFVRGDEMIFGDVVESIRVFDGETQRSTTERLDSVHVGPASEWFSETNPRVLLGDRLSGVRGAQFEDEVAAPMATAPGAVARPMGRVAAMLGRDDDADHWFALALELHARLEAPYLIARTELEWAECLVARGEPMDDPRVGPALERTRVTARAYGYPALERRAAALLDGPP